MAVTERLGRQLDRQAADNADLRQVREGEDAAAYVMFAKQKELFGRTEEIMRFAGTAGLKDNMGSIYKGSNIIPLGPVPSAATTPRTSHAFARAVIKYKTTEEIVEVPRKRTGTVQRAVEVPSDYVMTFGIELCVGSEDGSSLQSLQQPSTYDLSEKQAKLDCGRVPVSISGGTVESLRPLEEAIQDIEAALGITTPTLDA